MATIVKRERDDGTCSYRVGKKEHGKLSWVGTFDDPEIAADVSEMADRIGVAATIAVIKAREGQTDHTTTLAAQLDIHLDKARATARPKTIDDYRGMAERTWLPRLGPMPIAAITEDTITDWISWQRQQETQRSIVARENAAKRGEQRPPEYYTVKSIQNAKGLLSAVLKRAVRSGLIERNPAADAEMPKRTDKRQPVYIPPSKFVEFAAAFQPSYRHLVEFLAGTGARFSEATTLTVGAIDLTTPGGLVTLPGTKTETAPRTISLGNALVDMLRPLIAGRPGNERVFSTIQGQQIRSNHFIPRQWNPAVAKTDFPRRPRPHDLRHSHGSWLLQAGVPVHVVSRRLGHKSIQTTVDIYGHVDPVSDIQIVAATDNALAGTLRQIGA